MGCDAQLTAQLYMYKHFL